MQLFLNTYGTYLRKSGNMFEATVDGKKTKIAPERISGIVISTSAQLSTDAIKLALEYNIDILFLDEHGNPLGRVWLPRMGRTTLVRRKLLEIYTTDSGLKYVKLWTVNKIRNQICFLKRIIEKRPHTDFSTVLSSMKALSDKINNLDGRLSEEGQSLMGYEGNAGRYYFKVLSETIPKKYKFKGRSSQPAKDEFNAFLNYGYGILYGKVEKALIIAGLDPYTGLLHKDNYNKPSLVYDFIEPYRIFIEMPVFYLFSRQRVKASHTEPVPNGVKLSDEGKKFFIPKLMEHFDEIVRHRNRNMTRISQIQADAHYWANQLVVKEDKSSADMGNL